MPVELISVSSSAIAEVDYQNGTLAVKFHENPKTYELPNVPPSLFLEFINAPSLGEFWNRHLKGKFK